MINKDISYKEANENGIDTSMIKTCKKIRDLAKLDRIKLDETEHRSGLNKHLFEYIEYCGVDVIDFVKDYLRNIQPYMISRRKDQEPTNSFICIMDNLYRISVYIKINSKQFEEVIVSFHENNIRGVAKSNIYNLKLPRLVPVFADSVNAKIENENKYVIKIFAQRGLKVLPIEMPAVKCQDIFIVESSVINSMFLSYCNDYIKDLFSSNLSLDFDKIEVFSMLQQISFTSYGKDTFSSISLLIDSLNVQSDYNSKAVADFALVTYVSNLKLTEEQQADLVLLLDTKYMVSDIKKIDLILDRVKENLCLNYKSMKEYEIENKMINNDISLIDNKDTFDTEINQNIEPAVNQEFKRPRVKR